MTNPGEVSGDPLEDIVEEVRALLASEGADLRSWLYREIVSNALAYSRTDLDVLDLKVINRALEEFRHAAAVFKPYRHARKVSIFGSARVSEADPHYELAFRVSRMLVERGLMVITGAGEGIMRAGIEGAGSEMSFGVNMLLPFEQGPPSVIREDPKLITFRYFFIRKVFFVMEADAFVLFPGGFGTHDESFEVMTLLQTGKAQLAPLVLMELPGDNYWETWDSFVRKQLLTRGYISPEDVKLYKIVHSAEEAAEWITAYYSVYHSMRQVRRRLVIRLEKELSDDHLRRLNESFRDLLTYGRIDRTNPLPAEQDEPELLDKPRIVLNYHRKSAGRLNELILAINGMG